MSEQNNARANLERLFPSPFSDYQWSLIVAQGYADAIVSGARSAEDVAQELRGLMEAARASAAAAGERGVGVAGDSSLTWDEMEKLVLGRLLATKEASGPRLVLGTPSEGGTRANRLFEGRRRTRKLLWIALGTVAGLLVVVLVAGMVFMGLECGSDGEGSAATVTSDAAQTGIESRVLPFVSSTTTTGLPPETIPELKLPDYTAQLVGTEVVPSVKSEAGGTLELTVSEDGHSVAFVFVLEDLEGLTLARLRVGQPGEDGDEVFTLYPGPTKKGAFSGVAAEGSFSAKDLVGPLEGKTIADFVALVEEGSVYVIVGSTEHRGGELRGQLK